MCHAAAIGLQAGANTLNLNGSGAKSIIRATGLQNLGTAYSNGSYVDLMYDGAEWQALAQ